jgi:predicted SprT family Zn-dependent metalloprotease
MDLESAKRLAEGLLYEHGLPGWSFRFDHSRRRFGVCIPGGKRIQLSRHLTRLNGEAQVKDTILHEIAHAIAFVEHGPNVAHDRRWKKIAAAIGAEPRTKYDAASVETPQLRYIVKCAHHGILGQRARKWHGPRSCSRCHKGFNAAYLVELLPNPAF